MSIATFFAPKRQHKSRVAWIWERVTKSLAFGSNREKRIEMVALGRPLRTQKEQANGQAGEGVDFLARIITL